MSNFVLMRIAFCRGVAGSTVTPVTQHRNFLPRFGIACSRLSDSGEEAKEKAREKLAGREKGKRKGERASTHLF